MSYLTRVEVNQHRPETGTLLASPHLIHGAVNACFPPSARSGRILWRLDRSRTVAALYVVSEARPDVSSMVEQYGWPNADGGWRVLNYDTILPAVKDGSMFRFRLTASPSRSIQPWDLPPGGRNPRGIRVPVTGEVDQLDWFLERSEGWGFTTVDASGVSHVHVSHSGRSEFVKGDGRVVTFARGTFNGVLRVTNADVLRERLTSGIGGGKAYGCGLLTLAHAKNGSGVA